MTTPERNEVFRAIESTAHGLISWTQSDLLVAGTAALAGGLVNLIAGVVLFVVALLLILVGRRSWQGRRDYLALFARRFERTRHQRLLDPDTTYAPYALELEGRGGRHHG